MTDAPTTPMTIDLHDLMKRAFMAGFKASGKGYNGEYPFNYDANQIERELSEGAQDALERILTSAVVGQICDGPIEASYAAPRSIVDDVFDAIPTSPEGAADA